MGEMPKSRAALERAIVRYAGNDAVLPTVDEAITWANALIARIANA